MSLLVLARYAIAGAALRIILRIIVLSVPDPLLVRIVVRRCCFVLSKQLYQSPTRFECMGPFPVPTAKSS